MSDTKKDARGLVLPLLAAGAVLLAGGATASAAEQEFGNRDADGQNPSAQAEAAPSLHAALLRAVSDPQFADELLNNPEQFRSAYNLTDDQIIKLKNSKESIEGPRVHDVDYSRA